MRIQRMSDEAIAIQVGKAIRERRLRKNTTQEQLAEVIGVSTPTLQKLEKGKGTLAVLIAALRELNALELLTALTSPAPASPLAASKTPSLRLRAKGRPKNASKDVSQKYPGSTTGKLLFPKITTRKDHGESR